MINKMESKISKQLIVDYLCSHVTATEDELAEVLHLDIMDVLNILYEMEQQGAVRKVPDESSPDYNGG